MPAAEAATLTAGEVQVWLIRNTTQVRQRGKGESWSRQAAVTEKERQVQLIRNRGTGAVMRREDTPMATGSRDSMTLKH